ncbi:carbohydrate binding family 9 domain-containing protein [Undibacterium flavidum]|uniref:Carbohydrate binding family 9 domain-containing protein n=1 Tax=Undibacterium flavidum TaxID=2762297 RepID=A0ABR6YGA1_9BURK|nr:carbohydrate binding family 9 domain-containing protein [Undibacterium flavidum]MBC3875577.1 carbohydrate binding family 9 domain-containing protein [Undibacterium flavidum]
MLKKILIALCVVIVLPATVFIPDASAQSAIFIPRAKTPPQLADYLQGIPDHAGVAIQDFKQRTPGDGTPASRATTAYLSYDDTHLYAVFVAQDDPALIRAHIAKREDFVGDDFVVLELDTFHDKRRSFSFFANPYGVQSDSKRTEGLELDKNFDTQWESEGKLTDFGYVVRMAIPFKSLRFQNAAVQNWGFTVGRVIARLNEEAFWPHISKQFAGFVPQMAELTIPEKLQAGLNAQLNPFVYVGDTRLLTTDNMQGRWHHERKAQAGLDAKWVVGEASAIDVTIKPDFSEVESDEPQIVIDKRYEVLFPEKRPFFLENAGFFQTPTPLFFSRRVLQPQAGLRMTGRYDNWAYGALLIDDQAAAEDSRASAHIAVARVQNDVTQDLSLGGFMSDRRLTQQRDSVAGMDARYQVDDNWVVQAQLAGSQSQVESHQQSGHLYYLEAKHQGKHLEYLTKYSDISRDFANSLAFLPRTDLKQWHQEGKYYWHFDDEVLHKAGVIANTTVSRDQVNQLQDWSFDAGVGAELSRDSWLEVFQRRGHEQFLGKSYHKQGWFVSAGSSWFSWLSALAEFGSSDTINYAPLTPVGNLMGKGRSIDLTLNFKPHQQWRIEQKLLWNDLRMPAKNTALEDGDTVYRNLMWRSKFSYQHHRYLGLRVIADYHLLSSNSALTSLESGKQLNLDFQINYLLSPGTSLIAGYGNRQENLAFIPTSSALQKTEDLNLRTGRRAFIKLNYLYQL